MVPKYGINALIRFFSGNFSHFLIVLSSELEYMYLSVITIPVTESVCPSSIASSSKVLLFQILTVLS